MSAKPITQEQASALVQDVARQFGIVLVTKSNLEMYGILQSLLAWLKIPDITPLIESHSFTLGPFVYVNQDLGPDDYLNAALYECTRSRQWSKDGLAFAYYITAIESRSVRYQVEAMCSVIEVNYCRSGTLPDLQELMAPIQSGVFGVRDADLAKTMFESNAASLAEGIVSTEVGAAAVLWLRRNAQDLLHS